MSEEVGVETVDRVRSSVLQYAQARGLWYAKGGAASVGFLIHLPVRC